MKKIQNPLIIKKAIEKVNVSRIFSHDFSSNFELFEYAKDEFIINENSANDYLYFLVDGKVKCFSYSLDGKVQFITYLYQVQSIGIIGSIWRKPAVSNIQAVQKCFCLALSLSSYQQMLLDDNKFLRYLCQQLGDHLYNNGRYFQIIHFTSTESKLAAIILSSSIDGICHINLSSTAEFLGTTYRHVLRVLNKFCSNGILEKRKKDYVIEDSSYLTLLAKDSYDFIINKYKD